MKYLAAVNFKNIIFVLITLLWWGEFIIFNPPPDEGQKGKKTFYQILIAILSSIGMAFLLSYLSIGNFDANLIMYTRTIALIIYTSGLIIRYWSLIFLGKHFTRGISVQAEQELVKAGLYKHLRHPLYLGLFLLTIGAVSFVGNGLAILFAIIVMFAALRSRILSEEKYMIETLGGRYQHWKHDKDKFLPFIY